MEKLILCLFSAVSIMWIIGYLMAFFVDHTLQSLAQSVTPVMLPVVSALGAGLVFKKNGRNK